MAKAKSKDKKTKGRGQGIGMKARLFLIVIILLGVTFLPTSMLLFVGMIPSLFAFFMGARGRGVRASTVAAMNLSGCVPFIFGLWAGGNDFETSLDIISNAQNILIMYTAAAFGYMIDFVVTGLVSSFLYQKGKRRMKAIKERQKVIISLWGRGVAGKYLEQSVAQEKAQDKAEAAASAQAGGQAGAGGVKPS